ncbi:MAG: hypothetical protein ACYS74_06425 [Planctomycetota bacterium]
MDRSLDSARYYCDDIELLRELAGSGLKAGYLIRQTTLEDVFLKATGRQLDDRQ